ncbi:hypothetical protein HPP92_017918 [Vanilla planifolia]|uniref:Uncharacterized protein n=1 Tax=Vanilla planifolia TaxID=51239 RepID=A0A835Q8U7_VANPL|nr:hypothetical protein HPP92_017918 [Vanilla planifolia]
MASCSWNRNSNRLSLPVDEAVFSALGGGARLGCAAASLTKWRNETWTHGAAARGSMQMGTRIPRSRSTSPRRRCRSQVFIRALSNGLTRGGGRRRAGRRVAARMVELMAPPRASCNHSKACSAMYDASKLVALAI